MYVTPTADHAAAVIATINDPATRQSLTWMIKALLRDRDSYRAMAKIWQCIATERAAELRGEQSEKT